MSWFPIVGTITLGVIIYLIWHWTNTQQPGVAPTPPSRTSGWPLVLIAAFAVVVAIILTWGFSTSWGKSTTTTSSKTALGSAEVRLTEEWVFSWELPRGKYVRGLNKSALMVAEIIKHDENSLWINTPYLAYGRPEVTRMRLSKVGEKSWEGTWEQDNPKDFGRCDLHEVSPSTFAGHMTGTAEIPAFCTLRRR